LANPSLAPRGRARARRPRPLLKWAGGKRQLLPQIRRFYPSGFGGYCEPFAGSAAVFFDLFNAGRLESTRVTLIDNNHDLVGCYEMVRDRPGQVIAALRDLESQYRAEGERHFYRVRDEQFNPQRARSRKYTPQLAAMLIFLNRTGFNGLFRLNSRGGFNVPHGRYAKPSICDEDNITAVAAALERSRTRVVGASFDAVLDYARAGDFVYFDPPYAPVSPTSVFTSYTAEGFDGDDQERLRDVVVELAHRKCHVLLSNSTAPEIATLYDNPAMRQLDIEAHRVPARRAINSDPAARGSVAEYLITNIAPQP
jgi:DNA adenine methylase